MTTLYRFFDAAGALLYVGITDNLSNRISQHQEKRWWSDVDSIRVHEYGSRNDALAAESAAIRLEAPIHNVAGTGKRSSARPVVRMASSSVDDFISLKDAAHALGVSTKTVRRRVADGQITAYRVGPRLLRVRRSEVLSAMRRIPTRESS